MEQDKNTGHVLNIISAGGLVAIVRLADLSAAVPMSKALLAGGITALEFTLTNPAALATITEVKAALADFGEGRAVIGAGTVLDAAAAKASVEAGAQFIVSPHTNLDVIAMCRCLGVPSMPGALTPTEIVTAWDAGASVVKVFPARAFGPAYLKDVLAPLPHLKLMPTGGVDLENIGQFLKNGAFAVGLGSNLVDGRLIAAGDWAALTARASAYVQAVRAARGG
ncbi:MAG: bifunctional 4-hydroxy-2-oxoglutarate aldolase/2-dehydro-3-deoxy-phosphogluconate aldolase [Chloroflexi bacterium]|nr:bifunctional 4-hydroxy-2-oxoglutarate aldolase/2-dehydro-3-deoxy-phosphogluconate aldolase [Chloroflexota bacterium]